MWTYGPRACVNRKFYNLVKIINYTHTGISYARVG